MADISHLGTVLTIAASNTTGGAPVPLTHFPKDTDPVSIPSKTLGGMEIGTNGDPVTWSEATPSELTLALIPNTPDHVFMQNLLQLNTAEKGKRANNDRITIVRTMPNGAVLTAQDGKLIEGTPGTSQQSAGRLGTVTYRFMFGSMRETPPVLELADQI
jgi:hypothetical protein